MRKRFHPLEEGSDPLRLIESLQLITKEGKRRRIRDIGLFGNQYRIIDHVFAGDDMLIMKGRQIGSSTGNLLACFLLWFLSEEPEETVIMAHKIESAKKLFEKVLAFYDSLPESIRRARPLSHRTTDMIELADTGARFAAHGATQKGGLRSFTCQRLILTEFTQADRPDELLSHSLAALNEGQLIIECTARYPGDAMEREIKKAQEGVTDRTVLFFPWSSHEEYCDEDTKLRPEDLTAEERALQVSHHLSLGQLAWRRRTMGEYPTEIDFYREYPLTLEQAYDQSDGAFVSRDHLRKVETKQTIPSRPFRWEEPKPGGIYVVGVDAGGGVRSDYSSCHVMDARTQQVVAGFHSNTTSIADFADMVRQLAVSYNNATVNVETNGTEGGQVYAHLQTSGVRIMHIDGKPWVTSGPSKAELLDNLRRTLTTGRLRKLDVFTYHELEMVRVENRGKRFDLVVPKETGSHFDGGMSLGLALIAAQRTALPEVTHANPHLRRMVRGASAPW
jgi:hypothetical protein